MESHESLINLMPFETFSSSRQSVMNKMIHRQVFEPCRENVASENLVANNTYWALQAVNKSSNKEEEEYKFPKSTASFVMSDCEGGRRADH